MALHGMMNVQAPFLKSYTQFCNTFEESNALTERLLKTNSRFKRFEKRTREMPESNGLDLMSYLITPVQRVPRYVYVRLHEPLSQSVARLPPLTATPIAAAA